MAPEELNHRIETTDKNLAMHQETKNISYKALNNIIFVVSTGVFVLSVSFIGYLKSEIYAPYILILSWFFTICCIIGNFINHKLMIKQATRQIELINDWRRQGLVDSDRFERNVDEDKELNQIIYSGSIMNKIVLSCLVLGLFALFLFGVVNLLPRGKTHSKYQNFPQADWDSGRRFFMHSF